MLYIMKKPIQLYKHACVSNDLWLSRLLYIKIISINVWYTG